jgi:magnesium-transporting ATPase (P-type)
VLAVLQVLALDIGTDLLPALALGVEPPNPRTLRGRPRTGALIDRRMLTRVFGVLGPAEATVEMAAATAVLLAGGWAWGMSPSPALLATASGTAFTAVVLGQLANAFACRSETRSVVRVGWRGNPLLLGAVVVFLGVPPVAHALGHEPPTLLGALAAGCAIPAVLAADTAAKAIAARFDTAGQLTGQPAGEHV